MSSIKKQNKGINKKQKLTIDSKDELCKGKRIRADIKRDKVTIGVVTLAVGVVCHIICL